MKKKFLGLLLFVYMGLLATACSEDDNKNDADISQVRISAVIPEALVAARTSAVASHQLRCILEVWSQGAEAKLMHRKEVVVSPNQSGSLPFDFTVTAGTYDCLMWADYMDADTKADTYYDTSDLKNITIKESKHLLNNEACDAFFYSGEIQKTNNEALQLEVNMIRPFTKITVLEKNLREFNLLKGLSVSYDTFTGFNVRTGKAAEETTKVTFNEANFHPEQAVGGTLFTCYVFANAESRNLGKMQLSFTTDRGIQEVIIPEIIPLLRNQHIKVSGHMMAESPEEDTEFEISFDIEVEDWTSADVNIGAIALKANVGDFFYADGSYSSYYVKSESNPCIGIVFATAHDEGKASADKPENYVDKEGKQKLQKVNGWVVGLQEFKNLMAANTETIDLATLPGSAMGRGKGDLLGFKNTEAFKHSSVDLASYPAAQKVIAYENDPLTKAPKTTSGWYWGAANQYLILAAAYANVTIENKVVTHVDLLKVGESMEIVSKEGAADLLGVGGNFNWSSSIEESTAKLFRIGLLTTDRYYGQSAGWVLSSPRSVRAILTF